MPEIKLEKIFPNPDQPRKHFSEKALDELARSIKECGLLEPIVAVKRPAGFMIVAGERRWRACGRVGLKTAPVRIIEADNQKVAELALLENLQREDLNLIEEAQGYRRLMDLGLSMEQVAQKMGFNQPWRVRERLDLLRLDPIYQRFLIDRRITPSQAYEISRLPVPKQHTLYKLIEQGRAGTYNKLRSLANNLLVPPGQQTEIGGAISEEEMTVGKKYDRLLERLVNFVRGSFDSNDVKVLRKVTGSSVDVNINKLDLIMGELNKIKKALVEAQSKREAKEAA